MRLCGEAIPLCAGRIKACGFWAHHWDTQTLFVPSCLRCLRHMTSCTIQDLQCAWLLLLYCCGSRANYPQSGPPGADRRIRSPPRRFTPEMLQPPSWGCSCQHFLGSGQFATVSGRPWAPQCNIARKTRFLGKLGRLFGDDPPETPNRLRSHCGRLPCPAPFLPLGRGPRFWRKSGICWVPRTFLAGVGGCCSS